MKFYGQKIKTEIPGLDQLLFGGLYMQCPHGKIEGPLTIGIYGDRGTSKALLAMQMLHGITKSLRKYDLSDSIEYITRNNLMLEMLQPIFFTSEMSRNNVSDMLLDMLLAKCIDNIVEDNAAGQKKWNSSRFTNTIFDTQKSSLNVALDEEELDTYLGEEMLVYNAHTNALHLARPQNQKDREEVNDPPLFVRRYEQIGKYVSDVQEEMAQLVFSMNE